MIAVPASAAGQRRASCTDLPTIDLASGPVAQTCELETSPQTAVAWRWTLLQQPAPASGLIQFHDLFPPPGQAFYRTVQP